MSYETRISSYEQRITLITRESDDLRRQTQSSGDVLRKLSEYEDKFAMLSMEIERLNEKLRLKSVESADWESRFKQAASERDQLDVMAHDLQQQLQDSNNSNRKLQEYEQEIHQLGQEVEKINRTLRQKVEELSKQQQIISEMTVYRERYGELEKELELRQQRFEIETHRMAEDANLQIRNLETSVANYKRDIEELRKKANENSEINRRIAEYENKLAMIGQEVERLNEKLRGKVE